MNSSPFLVLGRNGTGKTAYGAKIRRVVKKSQNIIVHSCMLSDPSYSQFETFADQNATGGRGFLYIWKHLLLLEILKLIQLAFPDCENERVNLFIDALKECNLLPTEDIVHTAKHLNTTNISLNFKDIITIGKETEKEYILSGTDEITDAGFGILKDTYFGDNYFYIIIDSLDDALRGKQLSSDIITGLIRAADAINNTLRFTIHLKIIVLLRSDILSYAEIQI